jgi:hypothetical protein
MRRSAETGANPGQRYVRVALVDDTKTVACGLHYMHQVLTSEHRFAAAPRSVGYRSGQKAAVPA